MNLTKGNVGTHLRNIAIPASIGMLFSTMYNIVDTFYAGLWGAEALTALGVTFPLFFLILSIGAGISQGVSALVSNSLGEKRKAKANMFVKQGIGLVIFLSFFLTILGILIAPMIFRYLGLTDQTLPIAVGYMNVMFLGVGLFLLAYVTNAALLGRGDTKSIRNVFIIGFFLNIILNPIFMFTFKLGVPGIALATLVIYIFNITYYVRIGIRRGVYTGAKIFHFIPTKRYIKEILNQAIPSSSNMMTIAIGILIITYFVGRFGETALAAFSVVTRIEQIILLPLIGLNMAVLSLVGQNNGAKLYQRVREIYSVAIMHGVFVMIIGSALLFFLGDRVMLLFTDSQEILTTGYLYLKIAAGMTLAHAILFISQAFFLGMKKPWIIFGVGISRQVIVPLILFPLALIFFGTIGSIFISILIITWIFALALYVGTKIFIGKLES